MPKHSVQLIDGPLPPAPACADRDGACGASLCFEGIVRPTEDGRSLRALDYEAYEPMTTRQLKALCEQLIAEHGVRAIRVEHSVGRVAVGEVSFRLAVDSAHRKEGIAALDAFIDRMKAEVALWKRPVFDAADATPQTPN
ncbi:MAG: molybdenum cofactor biosynthesis protein MoaE [Planctomycetota bacterium]